MAGVCILSDGRDNAGGNLAEAMRCCGRARFRSGSIVCLGEQTDVRDFYVRARFSQNFLFVGQPAHLMVTLNQSGYDGFHVNVHLYRSQYVETRGCAGPGPGAVDVPRKKIGQGAVSLQGKGGFPAREGDVRNKERVLFARVVDRRSRVLLAEARPHWDSKFLLRALQEDPHLEVTSIFYLAPNKVFSVREQTSSETLEEERKEQPIYLPRTREALYGYDCVLLGKDIGSATQRRGIADAARLRVRARRRPGVLPRACLSGHPCPGRPGAGGVDDILRDVHWELTAEGRASPVFVLNEDQPSDLVVRSLPAMSSITRRGKSRCGCGAGHRPHPGWGYGPAAGRPGLPALRQGQGAYGGGRRLVALVVPARWPGQNGRASTAACGRK